MFGLLYSVTCIDGTHLKWLSCRSEQFYEYRCYMNYPCIVNVALVTADCSFTYADVERSTVLEDFNNFDRSSLKVSISNVTWLGTDISNLEIAGTSVLPYLRGDCAFIQPVNMIENNYLMITSDKTCCKVLG